MLVVRVALSALAFAFAIKKIFFFFCLSGLAFRRTGFGLAFAVPFRLSFRFAVLARLSPCRFGSAFRFTVFGLAFCLAVSAWLSPRRFGLAFRLGLFGRNLGTCPGVNSQCPIPHPP